MKMKIGKNDIITAECGVARDVKGVAHCLSCHRNITRKHSVKQVAHFERRDDYSYVFRCAHCGQIITCTILRGVS